MSGSSGEPREWTLDRIEPLLQWDERVRSEVDGFRGLREEAAAAPSVLRAPASEQQVRDAEEHLGVSFPASFRCFLLLSNGAYASGLGAEEARSPSGLLPLEEIAPAAEADACDACNRDGVAGILPDLDPAIEWRNPAEAPNAGGFIGREGVVAWQRLHDEAWDEVHLEPVRIDELPDGRPLFMLRFAFRMRAHGIDMQVLFAQPITIRDGKATALSAHTSEAQTLEAAGQAE